MATAPDNGDRLPRASEAQIASLRRRVASAGEELEREQEESVFTLARALGEINEGETWAHLDARLTFIENQMSRLSEHRNEIEQSLASELALMRTQMAEALEAVGLVAGPKGAPVPVAEKVDAIKQDVQKTLTSAGMHFSKRFKEMEQKWNRMFFDFDSVMESIESKAAVIDAAIPSVEKKAANLDATVARVQNKAASLDSLVAQMVETKTANIEAMVMKAVAERAEILDAAVSEVIAERTADLKSATARADEIARSVERTSASLELATKRAERLARDSGKKASELDAETQRAKAVADQAEKWLQEMKESAPIPGFPPEQKEQLRDLGRRVAGLESQAMTKEAAQRASDKLNERLDMVDKAIRHLVELSEVETARVSELQVLVEGLNDAVGSLGSRVDDLSRSALPTPQELEVMRMRLETIERYLPVISETSARLTQLEGPTFAMVTQLQAKLAEAAERLESLEVRAAFTTDILPSRRKR